MSIKQCDNNIIAPPFVYVEIDGAGEVVCVCESAEDAEHAREGSCRLARYKLEGFVEVKITPAVIEVKLC